MQQDVWVRTANLIPNPRSAGTNKTVCYNTPVIMDALPPEFAYELGTWTVSPSAGVVFSDIHSPNATVTGLLPNTTYTFTWTIRNGCGNAATSIIVDVTNEQGPTASNAGPDQCLGSGTASTTLSANNPLVGTGTWSQIGSTPNIANFDNINAHNTTVSGLINGTYQFIWAISSGACEQTRDTVMVTISPAIQLFTAGSDQQVCGTNAILLSSLGAEPTIGTGQWSQLTGSASIITNPDNFTTSVTGLVEGVYTYQYKITNGACSKVDTVVLYVSEPLHLQ
ncbi:MAG: hypothetical protein IPH57_13550 [Saprospiraceae bacterium]|nr:hypothetical protein [Saprospiraceae bacterium]